MEIVEVIEKI